MSRPDNADMVGGEWSGSGSAESPTACGSKRIPPYSKMVENYIISKTDS